MEINYLKRKEWSVVENRIEQIKDRYENATSFIDTNQRIKKVCDLGYASNGHCLHGLEYPDEECNEEILSKEQRICCYRECEHSVSKHCFDTVNLEPIFFCDAGFGKTVILQEDLDFILNAKSDMAYLLELLEKKDEEILQLSKKDGTDNV